MQVFKYVFSLIICFGIISTHAQKKSFELSNPNSIPLDNESLKTLTSGYWRVYKDELESREKVASTPKNVSICYYPNGTFIYNGSTGTWKVLEDRYKFDDALSMCNEIISSEQEKGNEQNNFPKKHLGQPSLDR